MLTKMLTKFFCNNNVKIIRRMNKIVDKINCLEKSFEKLSDKQIQKKTHEFQNRIKNGETLSQLIIEAFATVREASKRVFSMRHYDVQLLGGIILNDRCVAEMRTGEGKTLTSTLPAYLNALTGKGVHIVTVNDYLAKRDADINKVLFKFLNMNVGINLPEMSLEDKRKAYYADITYGTNNEYGFDYLRDNMVFNPDERVQRDLYYAIIDEVDSILIDEARTPLIISAPIEESSDLYIKINNIIPYLIDKKYKFSNENYFSLDEKTRQVHLTEHGLINIEKLFVKHNLMNSGESLYSSQNIMLMHHITAALRAHLLFMRDVDYIVKKNEVIIVDVHTGRMMPGRRWSDGLHQAIEAKEKIQVQQENQTLASITFQNYFRLYEKLSGMTGTAATEDYELKAIYKLNTIIVPTNKPMIRKDLSDLVYITEKEKINAIIDDIKIRIKKGQPILVGTVSIEKSEIISYALKKLNIKHKVLNAKLHAHEADIIAQAGKPSAVTIATNMAGRGTDIVLGGCLKSEISLLNKPNSSTINSVKSSWQIRHNAVVLSGGLHVIGTERHESRRIDNQLRGRSGRQGDPGSSRFYISMEDAIMRIFASDRISIIMRRFGMKHGESIEHPWITKAIENAQKKVESYNFDIRKQLLEYDDITNDQRLAIYSQRNEILNLSDLTNVINNITEYVFKEIIEKYIPKNSLGKESHLIDLNQYLQNNFSLNIPQLMHLENKSKKDIYNIIIETYKTSYAEKEKNIGSELMRKFEKDTILKIIDNLWKEHLLSIDYLRQGIHLRGYAQKDPKQEYKRESFAMFNCMLNTIKYELVSTLSKISINDSEKIFLFDAQKNLFPLEQNINQKKTKIISLIKTKKIKKNKIGRNDLCPCKSGKKYKYCHGILN